MACTSSSASASTSSSANKAENNEARPTVTSGERAITIDYAAAREPKRICRPARRSSCCCRQYHAVANQTACTGTGTGTGTGIITHTCHENHIRFHVDMCTIRSFFGVPFIWRGEATDARAVAAMAA